MRNCKRSDYPYLDMLRHHLPLADEIIIYEGFSTDGTYESIRDLDPKIKIVRNKWEKPKGENWWIHFKDAGRRSCTGDWCIHLDSDEFIPEWEFDEIRSYLSSTSDVMIPIRFTNFYGNCRVYHTDPWKVRWPSQKMIIHRNLVDEIEFWGDGCNVKLKDRPFTWETSSRMFNVHHFGTVRHPGRLREAWWSSGRFRAGRSIRLRPPGFVFNLFPHKWDDPAYFDDLAIYDGPLIKAVRDNPERFVRDDYYLVERLKERDSVRAPASVRAGAQGPGST
jgi:glycosyltransferase involved in cell wall biosynthesis